MSIVLLRYVVHDDPGKPDPYWWTQIAMEWDYEERGFPTAADIGPDYGEGIYIALITFHTTDTGVWTMIQVERSTVWAEPVVSVDVFPTVWPGPESVRARASGASDLVGPGRDIWGSSGNATPTLFAIDDPVSWHEGTHVYKGTIVSPGNNPGRWLVRVGVSDNLASVHEDELTLDAMREEHL